MLASSAEGTDEPFAGHVWAEGVAHEQRGKPA